MSGLCLSAVFGLGLAQATAPTSPAPAEQAATATVDQRLSELEAQMAAQDALIQQQAALLAQQAALIDSQSQQIRTQPSGHGPSPKLGSVLRNAGATVVPANVVVQDAIGFAGPVDVYGTVEGAAVAVGADVRVHPGAQVGGDAVSFGGRVEVDPAASVAGERLALSAVTAGPPLGGMGADAWAAVRDLARRLAMLLSFAGAGVLVVGFWPRQVDQIARLLAKSPVWYGVGGLILTAMGGVLALALTATILGAPLALVVLAVLSLAGVLGGVAVCKTAGEAIPAIRGKSAWIAFLVGAALFTVVGFLPWVGGAVLGMLAFPAIGAAIISRFGNRAEARDFD